MNRAFVPPPIAPYQFPEFLQLGGEAVPCERMPWSGSGLRQLIVVPGLPRACRQRIFEAAQYAEAAFGWRVFARALTAEEITPEVLARAEQLFEEDVARTDPQLLTFLVEKDDGSVVTAGCVAVRSRISPDYVSKWWVVGTRLIVHPDLRRAGLGNFIFAKTEEITAQGASRPVLGYLYPTENPIVVRFLQQRREAGKRILWCSAKEFREALVAVHLCFIPGAYEWLQPELAWAHAHGPTPAWRALAGELSEVLGTHLALERTPRLLEAWQQARAQPHPDDPWCALLEDTLGTLDAFGVLRVPAPLWPAFDRSLTLP